jgi:hypothetical protein
MVPEEYPRVGVRVRAQPARAQILDFISVEDAARAHTAAVLHLLGGGASICANVGAGRPFTADELQGLTEAVGGVALRGAAALEFPIGDAAVLDTARAQSVLGWQADDSMRELAFDQEIRSMRDASRNASSVSDGFRMSHRLTSVKTRPNGVEMRGLIGVSDPDEVIEEPRFRLDVGGRLVDCVPRVALRLPRSFGGRRYVWYSALLTTAHLARCEGECSVRAVASSTRGAWFRKELRAPHSLSPDGSGPEYTIAGEGVTARLVRREDGRLGLRVTLAPAQRPRALAS